MSQMPHADYGYVHRMPAVENLAYEIHQHLDVVPLFRIARKADKHQITPDLYGRNSVYAGQHVREYVRDTLLVTTEQCAPVFAEPFDRFFGNVHSLLSVYECLPCGAGREITHIQFLSIENGAGRGVHMAMAGLARERKHGFVVYVHTAFLRVDFYVEHGA